MKSRADELLVQQGLAESREKAKRLIMAGEVYFFRDEQAVQINKPGHFYPADTICYLKKQERFVSRGGYKLLTALEHFRIDVAQAVALDVGASTGGFTDCLLQFGAKRVYAVDVGYGQLHWNLRRDKRVVNLERINMRYAPGDLLPECVDIAVLDCSFISLQNVLPASCRFLKPGGIVLALLKPQFELEAGQTEKGVVRQSWLQQEAVQKVYEFVQANLPGLLFAGVVPCDIKGPKGNQEYMMYWHNNG